MPALLGNFLSALAKNAVDQVFQLFRSGALVGQVLAQQPIQAGKAGHDDE